MLTHPTSPISQISFVPESLPFEAFIRIELQEGIPIMRATDSLQTRIETLLDKQQESKLTRHEQTELERYEQLDDYLSYINRIVRNQLFADHSANSN